MLSMTAISSRSAIAQAALVRSGEVSSEELTLLYLERIERQNPLLSAFTDVLRESALREARAVDRARKRHALDTPFAGVPISIDDLSFAKGSFTRLGSRAFERFYAPLDDAAVTQLRSGGFVVIGKTATSELGLLPVCEPVVHPPTRNPWDRGVTPGGASGGAASALAAGLVPIAHAGDATGSIRVTASFTHLFGLKPSRGRVESSHGEDDAAHLYTCGPLARSVDDAAALLDVMAGFTAGKPHWAPPPPRPFFELAQRTPRPLRIHFAIKSPLADVPDDLANATRRIAEALAELGHHVEEHPPFAVSRDELLPLWQSRASATRVADEASLTPFTRWLREGARTMPRELLAQRIAKMARDLLEHFGDADLWLTPSVTSSPPKIGAWRDLPPEEAFEEAARLAAFAAPRSASGQPAASVPAGVDRRGHPLGAQLVARPMDEATLLAVCKQIEETVPWRDRLPSPIPE